MKTIFFILFAQLLIAQNTIYESDVFFDIPSGEPVATYDNTHFVEWFEALPPEWKDDLVTANYVEKRNIGGGGFYWVLPLKSIEWLDLPLTDQKAGVANYEVLPDSTPGFPWPAMILAWDSTGGLDTFIVDFDSVEVAEYFYPVDTLDALKKPDKIKFKKKQNGDIDYPTQEQFLSKAERKEFLKAHKIKKQKDKDK